MGEPRIVKRDGRADPDESEEGPPEDRYGLPPNVEFCSSCVVSNPKVTPTILAEDSGDSRKTTVPSENGIGRCTHEASQEIRSC